MKNILFLVFAAAAFAQQAFPPASGGGAADEMGCSTGTSAPSTGATGTCYIRTDTSPKEFWVFVATDTPYYVSAVADTTAAGVVTLPEATANGSNYRKLVVSDSLSSNLRVGLFEGTAPANNDCVKAAVTTVSGVTQVSLEGAGAGCGGGGSSIYNYYSGIQSGVSQTGSNVALYTVSNVPALPAGACYVIEYEFRAPSAPSQSSYIYVDATQIFAGYSGGGAEVLKQGVRHCNTTAQSAQQTDYNWTLYNTGNSMPYQIIAPSTYNGTSSIDWSTTHTIYIYSNAAGGNTFTPIYVHISQQ